MSARRARPGGAAAGARRGDRATPGARRGGRAGGPHRHHGHGRHRQHHVPGRFAVLLALVVVLNLVGLVMVLSASSVTSLHAYGSSWLFFNRRLLWNVLGFVALFVALRVDYRAWRRLTGPLLFVSFGLMVAVLVPGVGVKVNGARAWIGVGSLRFQPAELTKLALLLYTADLLARRGDLMHRPAATLRPVLFLVGVTGVLLMAQPDLGTAIVTVAVVLAVLFIAGAPLAPLGGVLVGLGALAGWFAVTAPYRRARLMAFLDPSADPLNGGFQTMQSLVGVASGGITGVGLGAGRAKWGFLPEAHTDFIFAVIAEELGLVGCCMVLALFGAFAVLGARAAVRAPDRYGTLLAGGVVAWVMVQALVNLGAVVGLLPITGLPLPFVSFGGSSLVVLMAATGMLCNIARQGRPAPARRRARPTGSGRAPAATPARAPARAGAPR